MSAAFDTATLWHELGHAHHVFNVDPSLDKVFVRATLDGSGDVEVRYATELTGPDLVDNALSACAFGFCSGNLELSCKILRSPPATGALFDAIIAADEPDLWSGALRASADDIAIIRSAGAIDPNLWAESLATAVTFVTSRGYQRKTAGWLAEYSRKGILVISREDLCAMVPA